MNQNDINRISNTLEWMIKLHQAQQINKRLDQIIQAQRNYIAKLKKDQTKIHFQSKPVQNNPIKIKHIPSRQSRRLLNKKRYGKNNNNQ